MATVSLEEVRKRFGNVQAIKGVSLRIEDGHFVTLLGPSGCGKTTTLNCIAGLEELTSGRILFDGRVVNDLSPRDRNIAMVFQDYALYPHMSVFDNLAFGLKMHRMSEAEIQARVKRSAEMLDIGSLLDRKPAQLSGGQRQRVAVGRAIIRDAAVFLMDEPLSNLDAALRVRTRTEIKALQKQLGVTTIYVTHDQEEAMVLSDKMAIMEGGLVQQYSTPDEAYNNPANLFVASFIGNPRMNFVQGRFDFAARRVVSNSVALNLPEPVLRRLEASMTADTDIVVGVRPEHVSIRQAQDADGNRAEVFLIEPVGPVSYLNVRADDLILKASVNPDLHFVIGDLVTYSFVPDKVYFFDAQTGGRLYTNKEEVARQTT